MPAEYAARCKKLRPTADDSFGTGVPNDVLRQLYRLGADAQNKYLGTVSALPPAFNFSYCICSVVKPAGASRCPAPTV